MIQIDRCKRLLDSGLSLIPIGDNKIPSIAWKKYQTEQIGKVEFEKHYQNAKGVGICTGFNNLEVIDVDLKIFPSLKEQNDFWEEYLSFLRDNIDEFDSKFVIYKTVNKGYHILYRCSKITGNKKIAKPEGYTEALIESRGVGGYVFVYDNQISSLSYTNIQEISELDRDLLWSISATYNHTEEVKEVKVSKDTPQGTTPPWIDFNEKNTFFDVAGEDFTIVRNLSDKYMIKRHGGTSPHSGYVFKNTGLAFIFSTGTIFPNEVKLTPFDVYTYKHHNGNISESAKDLYQKGYGSRVVKPKQIEVKPLPIINKNDLTFPIDVFPIEIQKYLLDCQSTLDSSIDYMGCSMLWLLSVVIGNSLEVEVKKGWREISTVWIAVVGKAGLGKTPSIANVIFPILEANNSEIKRFIKNNEKFEHYSNLDKKEKEYTEKVKQPVKTQFIANDITLEALVDLHQENKNSVGVFKDELAGWFKDMNKYREGSDLEFWLSTWSGKSVNLNRKTAKSSFVDKPLIPVLGGIQPSILSSFYTEENKDNGFVDRMLLCYPDLDIERYNEAEMDQELIDWYKDVIIKFYEAIKTEVVQYNDDGDIIPYTANFSEEARVEWVRMFNEITEMQNSDMETEYMKSMLPKQKTYIPRFSLLLNTLDCLFNESEEQTMYNISKESILKAERLSKYFIAMAKKIKVDSIKKGDAKTILKSSKSNTTKDKYRDLKESNNELSAAEIAEILGVSRQTIYRYEKENVTK